MGHGGDKSISVIASSPLGTTPAANHEITLEFLRIYLPLVVRE